MTTNNGFNPMKWDCDKTGCFNNKRRPKIETFAECFSNKISFGDVDGLVEVKGNALLLEWKSVNKELPTGQKILYTRLTHGGLMTAIVVVGNAETMDVTGMATFFKGKRYPETGYNKADLATVKAKISNWNVWANKNPAPCLDNAQSQ